MSDSPISEQTKRSVRVSTGARLHFGLIDTAAPFGGIGLMVQNPVCVVVAELSDSFACEPKDEPRFLPIAVRIGALAGLSGLPPVEVRVTQQPAAHQGLGSGTQLSMCAAEAIASILDLDVSSERLIQLADRGKRSAVGVHGFSQGGLIYEARIPDQSRNSVLDRAEINEEWTIVIFQPKKVAPSVSGQFESNQFVKLGGASRDEVQQLQSLIEKQIMPAAKANDFDRFVDSLQQYNRVSGKSLCGSAGWTLQRPRDHGAR